MPATPSGSAKPSTMPLIAACVAAQVGAMLGSGTFAALLPDFIDIWSLSKTDAGWINGIYFVGYLGAVPFLVSLTDRVLPRRIYYLCATVTILAGMGFALWADGFWTAMLFRLLGGIGVAGTYMPGLKLLSDHLEVRAPDYDHSRGVAFYVSGFGLGLSLSFFLSGVIADNWNWHWAFVVTALGPVFSITVLHFAVRGPDPKTAVAPSTHLLDFRPVLRCRNAMAFVMAYAVHNFELFAFRSWAVAYLVFAGGTGGGPVWGVSPATIIAGAILFGPLGSVLGNELSRRIGRRIAITFMMLTASAMALVIGFIADQSYTLVAGLAMIYCIAQVSDSASITAGAMAAAPQGYRGATMAVHSCIGFTGSFLGPVVFGLLLDLATPAGTIEAGVTAWGWAFAGIGLIAASGPVFLYVLRDKAQPIGI